MQQSMAWIISCPIMIFGEVLAPKSFVWLHNNLQLLINAYPINKYVTNKKKYMQIVNTRMITIVVLTRSGREKLGNVIKIWPRRYM